MKVVYDKLTGNIISAISDDQDHLRYYRDWSEEFKDNLAWINVKTIPNPLGSYYIKDGELIEYSEQEKEEKRIHGRVLTEEERLLEKLKPSYEEIREAEETIKILTLIQEVI